MTQNSVTYRPAARFSPIQHGTYIGYVHHRCRCDDCKEAKREYQRNYQKGVRLVALRTYPTPREEAFRRLSVGPPGECWLWQGPLSADGYGVFSIRNEKFRVHRVIYELLVGPIPEGLQIDHLCRIRNCANPAHLDPVTSKENCLRGEGFSARNARKKVCGVCGGKFHVMANGRRGCRACVNRATHEYYFKKKAEREAAAK